jgi:NAD(P)-dependent dehydrogenase (short-subunit alcohol dehydrogenase family)
MAVKTDRLITLFGGGGFIGRYAAQALFKAGCRVRIAEREPRRAFSLKPLAALGQIQFVRVDLSDKAAVAAACHGADAVVNLVGILKGKFHKVHVEGARNPFPRRPSSGPRSSSVWRTISSTGSRGWRSCCRCCR